MADTITLQCKLCGAKIDYLPNSGLPKTCDDCESEKIDCDHQCSSNCRHDGCPCQEEHYCQNSVL